MDEAKTRCLPIRNEASACARAGRNLAGCWRYPWQERSLWEELKQPPAAAEIADYRERTRRRWRKPRRSRTAQDAPAGVGPEGATEAITGAGNGLEPELGYTDTPEGRDSPTGFVDGLRDATDGPESAPEAVRAGPGGPDRAGIGY